MMNRSMPIAAGTCRNPSRRAAALGVISALVLFGSAAAGGSGAAQAEGGIAPPVGVDAGPDTIRRADGSTFTFAKPRVFKAPQYPRRMVDLGGEGWVAMSFVVQRDGTVRDPVVVDSSRREFEQAALDAVRQFRYDPAEVDGEAVEQVVPLYRIAFVLEPASQAARLNFRRRFGQIERLIERGELDQAAVQLAQMEATGRLNLYEDAFYWWVQAMYHGAKGEQYLRRESLRRAIAYAGKDGISGLPEAVHLRGLAFLYQDYVGTGEYAAALDAYEQLVSRAGPGKDDPGLRAHAETLRALLAGDAMIQAQGYIHDERPWAYALSRDGFEFADIDGELQRLSLWCEQRAVEMNIEPESSWQVPESWRPCRIYVRGSVGTTFKLIEYSSSALP
jgi:TonB family protein